MLDIINDLFNNLKENKFVQNFIKELSNYLEKNNVGNENKEVPIIDDILSKNNYTTGNKNSIRFNLKEVISNYAKNDEIYFVKDAKNEDTYTVLKTEGKKIDEIEINKRDMPREVKINDVLKMEDNNYKIDEIATKDLQEDIIKMAEEVLYKQNINLNKHRKEGHLYMVTEEQGDNRFLWDLTDKPKTEFEEVDIPKDLLNIATEGMVLRYINGKYEYYSDDGFERAEKT